MAKRSRAYRGAKTPPALPAPPAKWHLTCGNVHMKGKSTPRTCGGCPPASGFPRVSTPRNPPQPPATPRVDKGRSVMVLRGCG